MREVKVGSTKDQFTINSDGKLIAFSYSFGKTGGIALNNLDFQAETKVQIPKFGWENTNIKFSYLAPELLCTTVGGVIRIYDVNEVRKVKKEGLIRIVKGTSGRRNIKDVDWCPFDRNLIACAQVSNNIKIYDIRVNPNDKSSGLDIEKENKMYTNVSFPITFNIPVAIKFHYTDSKIACAYDSYQHSNVSVYDLRKLKKGGQLEFVAHIKPTTDLDWDPNDRHKLATCSFSSKFKIWDISENKQKCIKSKSTSHPLKFIRYTKFGKGLVSVFQNDPGVFLWLPSDNKDIICLKQYIYHKKKIRHIGFRYIPSKNIHQMVTLGDDKYLKFLNFDEKTRKSCGTEVKSSGLLKMSDLILTFQQEVSVSVKEIANVSKIAVNVGEKKSKNEAKLRFLGANYHVDVFIRAPTFYPNSTLNVEIRNGLTSFPSMKKVIMKELTEITNKASELGESCVFQVVKKIFELLENNLRKFDYKQTRPSPAFSFAQFSRTGKLVFVNSLAKIQLDVFKKSNFKSYQDYIGFFQDDNADDEDYDLDKDDSRINSTVTLNSLGKKSIFVYDQEESSISKKLAKNLVVNGEISKVCSHNKNICKYYEKTRLFNLWNVLESVLDKGKVTGSRKNDGVIKKLIASIFDLYLNTFRDVQTVAVLSCVVPEHMLPQKPYLFDFFRKFYSSVLFNWRFNCRRSEIEKKMSYPDTKDDGLKVGFEVGKITCSLCNLRTRGLAMVCIKKCQHGGHVDCMMKWFHKRKFCPTGCSCPCEFAPLQV